MKSFETTAGSCARLGVWQESGWTAAAVTAGRESQVSLLLYEKDLLAIGCMLSFWLFVRASKWMLFAHDSQMNRYCWYSYYIPMVLIPLLGGMLLPHIGQSERYRPGKSRRLWYIPAVSLMGLVLTNDLHQLVFRFPDGIVFFQNRYTYQIGYFVIFAWCLLWGFYFVGGLLLKCRIPARRQYQWLPVLSCVYFTSFYF